MNEHEEEMTRIDQKLNKSKKHLVMNESKLLHPFYLVIGLKEIGDRENLLFTFPWLLVLNVFEVLAILYLIIA